ncbi:C45 family autoproteolytic acyltransferase/hydolase [Limnoglobus roseus]|uniref:Choloylglycine hydrolase n=1 Tax=Limnoglobus roseus TaxID=2598579 RepID=A0A5C1APT5_9BACT|nr:C45 family peptidase [Limnoglobus roseus]QEL21000.1 choloylglycine hydrolase [Limnoglobus roseus]
MPKRLLSLVVLLAFAPCLPAQTPRTFPDAKHKGGELVHVSGLPVLTVRGTPEEIGEQLGVLAVKNAPGLIDLLHEFLKDTKKEDAFDGIKLLSRQLKKNFPKDHLTEMEAAVKVSGQDIDLMYFANTIYDLSSGMGCATIVVEPGRSKTGAPVFGRNFDWMPSKGIDDHTLVVVYRPTGKKAFATVTISPITGCISGMNEDGLAVTINEIHLKQSKDKPSFNWKGTPTLALFRRVLEECGSVAEAESLLTKAERTTTSCMTLCDVNGGAVFEITPKTIAVRKAENEVCCCTNHFFSDTLGIGQTCKRLTTLLPLQKADTKLGVSDVFDGLDSVNQGKYTLQTMVFEPKSRTLHLRVGDLVASATKMKTVTLELPKLFAK